MKQIRGLFSYLPVALIACALLVRALVPTGWMPSVDAHGLLRIIACPEVGMTMANASDESHEDAPVEHSQGRQCEFSVLGLAFNVAPPIAVPFTVPPVPSTILFAVDTVSIGRGLAAPPPPSTGPPAA